MAAGGASESGTGAGRRAGAVLCAAGVVAVFAGLATQARELTSMYGGFLAWISLLLLVGAVGGAIVVALTYAGIRLGRVRRHRGRIVGSSFVVSLLMSLAGGFVGSLQHDPVRQQRESERALAEECRRQGGTYEVRDLSCSSAGDGKPTTK